jgi:hypothetical protein
MIVGYDADIIAGVDPPEPGTVVDWQGAVVNLLQRVEVLEGLMYSIIARHVRIDRDLLRNAGVREKDG